MSEEQSKTREAADEAEQPESKSEATEGQTAAAENGAEGQDEPEQGGAGSLEEQLESLQAELEEARGDRLRAIAELENVRKRARRDVEQAHKFAVEKLAGELLNVRDSLEMGLQAAADENPSVEQLREGKQMTLRQLSGVMERAGISEINPQGERFNPEYHEAMTTQPSAEHEPDTVMSVVQKGYMLKDRLLRPARVIVARAAEDDSGGDSA